jgi:hypothetical protein
MMHFFSDSSSPIKAHIAQQQQQQSYPSDHGIQKRPRGRSAQKSRNSEKGEEEEEHGTLRQRKSHPWVVPTAASAATAGVPETVAVRVSGSVGSDREMGDR